MLTMAASTWRHMPPHLAAGALCLGLVAPSCALSPAVVVQALAGRVGATGMTRLKNLVIQLRKCSNHPYLLMEVDRIDDPAKVVYEGQGEDLHEGAAAVVCCAVVWGAKAGLRLGRALPMCQSSLAAAALPGRRLHSRLRRLDGAGLECALQELEELIAASGKLSLLDKMMHRLVQDGHRVLIYSQFTRECTCIGLPGCWTPPPIAPAKP